MRRSDLADISYFLALARHRNFRRAGIDLGISASALSHALKGLEERLGVRLLNRTSRSVTLTAAGETLRDAVRGPFDDIGRAVEGLDAFRSEPRGRIRLSIPTEAAEFLVGPVLGTFAQRYPGVELELSVNNRMIDVIAGGYDAGIRYGGTVPEDMIAQRLSADIRWLVVAAPSYLAHHGVPQHPDDLLRHRCIRVRVGDERIYRWEFERGEEEIVLDVPGSIIVDQGRVALNAVIGGAGLMYMPEPMAARLLAEGLLVTVLDDWTPMGPGFHIYFSGRRQVPPPLRLLIDLIREMRPLGL